MTVALTGKPVFNAEDKGVLRRSRNPKVAAVMTRSYSIGDFGKAEDRFLREQEEESPNTAGRDAA